MYIARYQYEHFVVHLSNFAHASTRGFLSTDPIWQGASHPDAANCPADS